jgi:hypothetical protein
METTTTIKLKRQLAEVKKKEQEIKKKLRDDIKKSMSLKRREETREKILYGSMLLTLAEKDDGLKRVKEMLLAAMSEKDRKYLKFIHGEIPPYPKKDKTNQADTVEQINGEKN